MGEIIVNLLLVTVVVVAWIECYPDRLDRFANVLVAVLLALAGVHWLPRWYGWLMLLAALAQACWTYLWLTHEQRASNPLSRLLPLAERASALLATGAAATWRALRRAASGAAQRINYAGLSSIRRYRGKILTAAVFVLTSPIAGIPWALLLALLLGTGDPALGQSAGNEEGSGQMLRPVLGTAYVVWITAVDLAARHLLVVGPVLLGVALPGVALGRSADLGPPSIRYPLLWLSLGAAYPCIWLSADYLGWSAGPVFN